MNITTVEVPINCDDTDEDNDVDDIIKYHHHEDGTESTGSDTLETTSGKGSSSGNSSCSSHHYDASCGQNQNSHGVSSTLCTETTTEQYEQMMNSFGVAMTELQRELRDKTMECEALMDTVLNLSHALTKSDQILQNITLKHERLQLKLQMVTFHELSDHSDTYDPLGYNTSTNLSNNDNIQYGDNTNTDHMSDKHIDEYYSIPQRPAAVLDTLPNNISKTTGRTSLQLPPSSSTTTTTTQSGRTPSSPPKPETMKHNTPIHTAQVSINRIATSHSKSSDELSFVHHNRRPERNTSRPVCVDDDDNENDDDVDDASINHDLIRSRTNRAISNPVCVDDGEIAEEYERRTGGMYSNNDKCNTVKSSDGGMQILVGPSQAHFYHVILERDMAKQTNEKLIKDLKCTKNRLRELKVKLDHSTALLELGYSNTSSTNNKKSQQMPCGKVPSEPKKSNSTIESSKVATTTTYRQPTKLNSWSRNYGIGLSSNLNNRQEKKMPPHRYGNIQHRKDTSGEEYISFISDDEMISKNWNKVSDEAAAAASTEEYLRIMFDDDDNDDSDRGAGGLHRSKSSKHIRKVPELMNI